MFTVFSCTNYGGTFQNKAYLLMLKKNYMLTPKLIDILPGSTARYPISEQINKRKPLLKWITKISH